MTPDLVIYRGLPASGKTTAAKAWVAEDPANRARVNRDSLRLMLHGGYFKDAEKFVVIARDRLIRALLQQGVSVACDDTNLPQKVAREIAEIGVRAGATVSVVDLTDVPLEECIVRDEVRQADFGTGVGEDVIRGMYERFLSGGRKLAPLVVEPKHDAVAAVAYVPRPGTPKAIMVDLDGTLCLHDGRDPYDETLVSTDVPNPSVVEAIRAMARAGYRVIFCSGRTEACAPDTLRWINEHVGEEREVTAGQLLDGKSVREQTDDGFELLLMREVGDRRRDSIVKRELFDQHIRDNYDVAFVLDDRQQVVDAWREIGLTVFQVAPGDF